jgi:ribosome-associated protein
MDELEHLDRGTGTVPSKSRRKREMHALQDLARRLISLPPGELRRLSLGAAVRDAIDEAARIKDPRARRRQYKHIANLLAGDESDRAHMLLNQRETLARRESARLHRLERWRDRLIEEGDAALQDLLRDYPGTDRQRLRTLVRAARRDRERGTPDAPRKLFRFLREEVDRAEAGEDPITAGDGAER